MKSVIIGVMCFVGLYGLLHLGEISAFYADPKATVLQQVSLRINLGFITLSLILCVCTIAILDALEKSRSAPVEATPAEEDKATAPPPTAPPPTEMTNEQQLEAIRNKYPLLRSLMR